MSDNKELAIFALAALVAVLMVRAIIYRWPSTAKQF